MKSWKKPTAEQIEKALGSVRKEIDRQYFFSRLRNPLWIQPLVDRGYFKSPPQSSRLPDGSVQSPIWPELEYLKNVSSDAPEDVTNAVLDIPEVNNPLIYDGILEIALRLSGELSGKLKTKMLEYAEMRYTAWPHRYAELLAHWVAEGQTAAALELAELIVAFVPDSDEKNKRERHIRNPRDWTTVLNPSPRFDEWDYRKILEEGVRPLADKEPFQVACLLTDVVAKMIYLRMHRDKLDQNNEDDASEIWCRVLSRPSTLHGESEELLVATLTYACELVFEKDTETVASLEEVLRKQRWKLFKRLRHHLYALYPNEQTKIWIREVILNYGDYAQRVYHYEFQRMVRLACEHFGQELLTQGERESTFDAILSGPSETLYRARAGEQFTEELYKQYQRWFHAGQLRPFASVMFAHYSTYYQDLSDEANDVSSDENYHPVGAVRTGARSLKSPQSPKDLAERSDEELLAYINEWDDEYRDQDNWLIEISIEALVEAFQTVFRESVLPDTTRVQFWLENKERIQRPIYVRAITTELQGYMKAGNLSRLQESLVFCEWVLSHPDREPQRGYDSGDKSRENPNWNSSRRAVGYFVEGCLSEDVGLFESAKGQLAKLFEMLCTEYDWRLDEANEIFPGGEDQFAEAINNTRSLALENLIRFGLWMRRNDSQADISLVMTILEARFSPSKNFPLTAPEHAILGVRYVQMLGLDEVWAVEHVGDFFPQHLLPEWRAAFENLLRYTEPFRPTFEVLREDFSFAVEHLIYLEQSDRWGENLAVNLGEHLFIYYIWGLHPLSGDTSLMEQFYRRTSGYPLIWKSLFGRIGIMLRNTDEQLEESLKERLIAYFEWRLEVGNATELGEFDHWLEAGCLDPEWRLDSYSRTLDVGQPKGWSIYGHVEALYKMLSEHPAKVVECFSKLTDWVKDDAYHISTDVAAEILRAGFESGDEEISRDAEHAGKTCCAMDYLTC